MNKQIDPLLSSSPTPVRASFSTSRRGAEEKEKDKATDKRWSALYFYFFFKKKISHGLLMLQFATVRQHTRAGSSRLDLWVVWTGLPPWDLAWHHQQNFQAWAHRLQRSHRPRRFVVTDVVIRTWKSGRE